MRLWSLPGLVAAVVLAFVMPLGAQQYSPEKPLGASAQSTPAFLKNAGIRQNLGNQLPLSDHFLDSSGADVSLGTYFEHRPVVLALVYYNAVRRATGSSALAAVCRQILADEVPLLPEKVIVWLFAPAISSDTFGAMSGPAWVALLT